MKAFVSKLAPQFQAKAYSPAARGFVDLSLDSFKGRYLLLNFYPLDFTFVCPTELVELSRLAPQFAERNCTVIACSTDSHFSHKAWAETPQNQGGLQGNLQIDLLSDFNKTISRDYGVLLEDAGLALRGSFLIDPEQMLRHSVINDLPVGRNIEEFLRVIDAFEFVKQNGEVCPAQWKKKGDPTMKGSHEDEKTKENWNKHFSK